MQFEVKDPRTGEIKMSTNSPVCIPPEKICVEMKAAGLKCLLDGKVYPPRKANA